MDWLKLRHAVECEIAWTYTEADYYDELLRVGEGCLADAIERDRLYRFLDALLKVERELDLLLAYEDMGPNV